MARPALSDEDQIVETWEITIPGTIHVWAYNRRNDVYEKATVSGRDGSKRLHLRRDDRKYNQEQIPVENLHLDPFTNGMLRLLDVGDRDESLDLRYHYSNEQLVEMFSVQDLDTFSEMIDEITSELILRRLVALAETKATNAQLTVLKELIEQRYAVGGTQSTVREMLEAGDRIGATRL